MSYPFFMGDTITIKIGENEIPPFQLRERGEGQEFSTGSRGYSSNGSRFWIGDKQYIVNVNLIEVGSKPKDTT